MKFVSIDLETTGTDGTKHQILEFGAVYEDSCNPKPISDLPTFHTYIIPDGDIVGEPYAINLNQEIIKKISQRNLNSSDSFIYAKDLPQMFFNWLVSLGFKPKTRSNGQSFCRITAAGKNFGNFDLRFLENVPGFTDFIEISSRIIDPSILYMDWQDEDVRYLPSLSEAKEKAGLGSSVAHLAVDDAKDIIKLLREHY